MAAADRARAAVADRRAACALSARPALDGGHRSAHVSIRPRVDGGRHAPPRAADPSGARHLRAALDRLHPVPVHTPLSRDARAGQWRVRAHVHRRARVLADRAARSRHGLVLIDRLAAARSSSSRAGVGGRDPRPRAVRGDLSVRRGLVRSRPRRYVVLVDDHRRARRPAALGEARLGPPWSGARRRRWSIARARVLREADRHRLCRVWRACRPRRQLAPPACLRRDRRADRARRHLAPQHHHPRLVLDLHPQDPRHARLQHGPVLEVVRQHPVALPRAQRRRRGDPRCPPRHPDRQGIATARHAPVPPVDAGVRGVDADRRGRVGHRVRSLQRVHAGVSPRCVRRGRRYPGAVRVRAPVVGRPPVHRDRGERDRARRCGPARDRMLGRALEPAEVHPDPARPHRGRSADPAHP